MISIISSGLESASRDGDDRLSSIYSLIIHVYLLLLLLLLVLFFRSDTANAVVCV